MSYRTILVHCGDERRLPALLAVAAPIAKAAKSRLVGLAVMPPVIVVPAMEGAAAEVIEDHRETYRAEMDRMRDAFAAATKAAGVESDWEELDVQVENPFGTVAMVAVDRARCADLLVVGQTDPTWSLSGLLDIGEDLVTQAGRPVLVVPKSGPAPAAPKRVVVAWNGSREASRAVFDAMPVLAAADEVHLVSLDQGDAKALAKQPGRAICEALKAHGVKCGSIEHVKPMKSIGGSLLGIAKDRSADLVVMGCYGHSRLREFVLGGATRYVLDHMTLPVLMSH